MKVLSSSEGDGLLTNAEVLAWLKDKKFEKSKKHLSKGELKPSQRTVSVTKNVRKYIESTPAGTVSVDSVNKTFSALEKFNLSSAELLMIANISPEAYAQLTALITDVHSRYDDDQIYEMLEVINNTMKKPTSDEAQKPIETEEVQDIIADNPVEIEEVQNNRSDNTGIDGEPLNNDTDINMEPAALLPTGMDISQLHENKLVEMQNKSIEQEQSYEGGARATILDYSIKLEPTEAVKEEQVKEEPKEQ